MLSFAALCRAQTIATAQSPPDEALQWRSGLSEINEDWAEHDGDNMAWAQPGLDDRAWTRVDDLEDMGPAQTGWRWFRKHVHPGPEHPKVLLLLQGGDGTYEIYVNGQRQEGASIRSALEVTRPKEQVFPLENDEGDFEIALRTFAPPSYAAYRLPLFLSVTLGGPTAIRYEHQALESERLYALLPGLAINLALCLAAIGAFALFGYQRNHREYLYLGLYLLFTGMSNGSVEAQQQGALPNSVNFLFGDPLLYLFSIAQIEFTFSFAGQRVGRGWRIYETILLAPLFLIALVWMGLFRSGTYFLVENIVTIPVALALPVLLFLWWRRGNREAVLLILPSMLPAGTGIVTGLGGVSIYLGWGRFDSLANPIQIGPVQIALYDVGTLLFLLAIGVVMFFRFTRVSREQARAAAELEAAREIQQRLVPAALPEVPGFRIEAAYLPADEVGGDFYQVLPRPDGSMLIALGDVSGKGLKAAMTGALAIGALRTLASEGLGPAELLKRLNGELVGGQNGGFITCFCAVLDERFTMRLANAGHLAPYRNGEELSLSPGLPLGITLDATYSETTLRLEAGDAVTFLSDGVVEARSASGELFGFERTRDISRLSAHAIAGAAQRHGQEDDITVLTLAFAPAGVLHA